MIVIASANGNAGIRQAVEVLRNGGSALDAVETGIWPVEDNPLDNSVGFGGLPNILGKVELDALIMDGRTLQSGAVGCVSGFAHPISLARKVMEKLPHVFLVGPGAERFGREMGFAQQEMLSDAARAAWREKLASLLPADEIERLEERADLAALVRQASSPKRSKGTTNFIARTDAGDLAVGVSTSGWGFKYPGRLGDSPVIGAGGYADNRYGAAACTGMGEMAIRASTARSVVLYMKMGMSLTAAGTQAMEDLRDLGGPYLSGMNIIAMDRDGSHAAFSSAPDQSYVWMTGADADYTTAPRARIELPERWDDEA